MTCSASGCGDGLRYHARPMSIAIQPMTLARAEERYRTAREAAHRSTVMTLRSLAAESFQHLTITDVTVRAIQTFQTQWDHQARRYPWEWDKQVLAWRKKRASQWEMAIWHKQVLCGLVVGGPSRRRSRLYVEGIEGNPSTHPLKGHIIAIALLASERYAEGIGCAELWLVNPAEELIDEYRQAGYHVRPSNRLLAKILRRKSFAVKRIEGAL